MATTVNELIETGADGDIAIAAPDRTPLTYGGLRALVARTVADLNGLGIGRNDRVAIVLPNGPEMATAFVAVAAGATTAPLNPAYRSEEFRFYLEDLNARALFVEAGSDSPAIEVAREMGVPVLELAHTEEDPAGAFEISGDAGGGSAQAPGMAAADDVALVLHTSGTTSRPKIVPLSQTNICASASHIGATLALMRGQGAGPVTALIGPTIRQPSYQVGAEMRETCLASVDPAIREAAASCFLAEDGGRFRFDLPGYLLSRLEQKGVESAALDVDTYDDDRFFSHRRATHLGQPVSGRLISMIRRSA